MFNKKLINEIEKLKSDNEYYCRKRADLSEEISKIKSNIEELERKLENKLLFLDNTSYSYVYNSSDNVWTAVSGTKIYLKEVVRELINKLGYDIEIIEKDEAKLKIIKKKPDKKRSKEKKQTGGDAL